MAAKGERVEDAGEHRVAAITDPSARDRVGMREEGRALRERAPLDAHGEWSPGSRDPLAILKQQATTRVPELVPLRHTRMAVDSFAFYRGGAAIMAADLAATATTGVNVQACGDAHLLNFGLYASPERRLVFDVNDFDETLPGPWEWDLKRLAASVVLAGRALGLSTEQRQRASDTVTLAYAEHLHELVELSTLDVWYSGIDAEQIMAALDSKRIRRGADRVFRRARRRTGERAFQKLTEVRDGHRVIVDQPPVVVHVAELGLPDVLRFMLGYAETLPGDRVHLLHQFDLVDAASKVVGVGSVGTRCLIVVGEGRAELDPLILQVKEAEASVLAPYVGDSVYEHQGQRVVEGQRLMQATSDPFLGWSASPEGHHFFYVRQLRDMKGGVEYERMTPQDLAVYSGLCATTLARAHARSLDPALLAGYCGKGRKLAAAVTRFAEAYADQAERDHRMFTAAIAAGAVETMPEE
ncbi:MAG TPA: DUF2252 domain-containing protein [Acidimicrobiia bacterium]|nr:DUF2252 domain-containing protein [Acidimicrobiia bacterium]